MIKLWYLSKNNKILILSYVMILSLVGIGNIFFIGIREQGYHPEVYESAYMYGMILSLLMTTIIFPLWEIKSYKILKISLDTLIFYASSMPIFVAILTMGHLSIQKVFIGLLIQWIWGVSILSLKHLLKRTKIQLFYKNYIMMTIGILFIITLFYLYFYIQYNQLVITTFFDQDIPKLFFIHPLWTLVGSVCEQLGKNQMGNIPLYIYFGAWSMMNIGIMILNYTKMKKCRSLEYERD